MLRSSRYSLLEKKGDSNPDLNRYRVSATGQMYPTPNGQMERERDDYMEAITKQDDVKENNVYKISGEVGREVYGGRGKQSNGIYPVGLIGRSVEEGYRGGGLRYIGDKIIGDSEGEKLRNPKRRIHGTEQDEIRELPIKSYKRYDPGAEGYISKDKNRVINKGSFGHEARRFDDEENGGVNGRSRVQRYRRYNKEGHVCGCDYGYDYEEIRNAREREIKKIIEMEKARIYERYKLSREREDEIYGMYDGANGRSEEQELLGFRYSKSHIARSSDELLKIKKLQSMEEYLKGESVYSGEDEAIGGGIGLCDSEMEDSNSNTDNSNYSSGHRYNYKYKYNYSYNNGHSYKYEHSGHRSINSSGSGSGSTGEGPGRESYGLDTTNMESRATDGRMSIMSLLQSNEDHFQKENDRNLQQEIQNGKDDKRGWADKVKEVGKIERLGNEDEDDGDYDYNYGYDGQEDLENPAWQTWLGDWIDNIVTVKCFYPSVAQKSYGNEKRFLCPPPAVLVWGRGESAAIARNSVMEMHVVQDFDQRSKIQEGMDEMGSRTKMALAKSRTGKTYDSVSVSESQTAIKTGHENKKYSTKFVTNQGLHNGNYLTEKNVHELGNGNSRTSQSNLTTREMVALARGLSTPAKQNGDEKKDSDNANDNRNFYVDTYDYALFKCLHVINSGKNKDFRFKLQLKMPYVVGRPVSEKGQVYAELTSEKMSIISKPSKKTNNSRGKGLCVFQGSTVSLFNRINSQTFRTRFMSVERDSGEWEALPDNWHAFRIVDVTNQTHRSLGSDSSIPLPDTTTPNNGGSTDESPLFYNAKVVLESQIAAFRSPVMIIRKVVCGKLVDDGQSPVCQMHKIAFELCDDENDSNNANGNGNGNGNNRKPLYLCAYPNNNNGSGSGSGNNGDGNENTNTVYNKSGRNVLSFLPLSINTLANTNNNNRGVKCDTDDSSSTNSNGDVSSNSTEIGDAFCWTIVGIDCSTYTFSYPINIGLVDKATETNVNNVNNNNGNSNMEVIAANRFSPISNTSQDAISSRNNQNQPYSPIPSHLSLPIVTSFPDMPDSLIGYAPRYLPESNQILCLIKNFDPKRMEFFITGKPATKLVHTMAPMFDCCESHLASGQTAYPLLTNNNNKGDNNNNKNKSTRGAGVENGHFNSSLNSNNKSGFTSNNGNHHVVSKVPTKPSAMNSKKALFINEQQKRAKIGGKHTCCGNSCHNSSDGTGGCHNDDNQENQDMFDTDEQKQEYDPFIHNLKTTGSCHKCACGCASISPCSSCSTVPTSLACSAGGNGYLGIYLSLPGMGTDNTAAARSRSGRFGSFNSNSSGVGNGSFKYKNNTSSSSPSSSSTSSSTSSSSPLFSLLLNNPDLPEPNYNNNNNNNNKNNNKNKNKNNSNSNSNSSGIANDKSNRRPNAYPIYVQDNFGIKYYVPWAIVLGEGVNGVKFINIPNVV
ncbi:Recombining binding protein suppressor of hairless-like protein [Zancudomyces culisetae]|uniref:Recombining binding protein suppressor of hairless-like protein n=1 Tax=Zancudomyces culisetae TaxID=1213189 RepID=A0A1R1PQ31_ZANCU|nr:Recombining binding protein suppressor of hairless-like protein [Zancudomyces culisetae]|eukprot:OMH83096.1 Recombining binding protein suppressor of hairless-like protein [Zancudomyces culisetae]